MNNAAPTIDPTTIPAIAPPERPELLGAGAAALLVDADGLLLDVEDGNSGGMDVIVGSITPGQRLVTFDPMQHESVALGELEAQ